MKKILLGIACSALLFTGCGDDTEIIGSGSATGSDTDSSGTDTGDTTDMNIVEVAVDNGSFGTLVAALTAAELDDDLQEEGPFTVFAPTDAAFALLPDGVVDGLVGADDKTALQEILQYHVVSGEVMAADVVATDSADTLLTGESIGIQTVGSTVVLNGVVQVTMTDIEASNGVIHVIDSVLLPGAFPGDLVQAASAHPIFSDVVSAVAGAGLASTLAAGEFTLFAPINDGFDEVAFAAASGADQAAILTYHAVSGSVDAATVVGLTSATTVQGEDVTIAVDAGAVSLNGDVNVIATDYMTSNGIIHVIDSALTPPSLVPAP